MDESAGHIEPKTSSVNQHYSNPQEPSALTAPIVFYSLPRPPLMEPNWKPTYPEGTGSSQDLLAFKDTPLEELNKTAISVEPSPSYDPSPRATIQPLEIFPAPTELSRNRSTLTDMCSIPASPEPKVDVDHTLAKHKSTVCLQDEVTRHKVSKSHATVTEVITTTLIGGIIPGRSDDRAPHDDLQANVLPNGESSHGVLGESGPISLVSHAGSNINSPDSPSSEASTDSEAQRKAAEILKALRNQGFSVQKDLTHSPRPQNPGSSVISPAGSNVDSTNSPFPLECSADPKARREAIDILKALRDQGFTVQKVRTHSPRPRNPGSASSSKSETCEKCGKFTGRPCELKYVFTFACNYV
jgi:hypothetical protein